MTIIDALNRYDFAGTPIRGEWTSLEQTWREISTRQDYPPALRPIVAELLAAAALLTATLKLDGSLIIQVQGKGPLKLLVVECTNAKRLRATARWEGELTGGSLPEMTGEGVCAITLDQGAGKPTYQGLVPLEGASVAQMLENYMTRSEQIDTRIWLAADERKAVGFLLQKLPEGHGDPEAWNRLQHLADTVTREELLSLNGDSLFYRLFNEEQVRLLASEQPHFGCSCSREKVGNMLKLMGKAEVDSILEEQGELVSECEFCHSRYTFRPADAAQLFKPAPEAPPASH